MLELLLLVSVTVAGPRAADQDSVRRAAERAAFRYESLLRRRAPSRLVGGSGECDEVIGRFCFRFTDGDDEPPPPVHPDIPVALRRAVAAYRAWFSLAPAEPRAVGPLLRYLVEDDRSSEAVAAARTHAWAAGRSPTSMLLLGMALHHNGEFAAAEAAFDSARAGLEVEERKRLDDIGVLLAPSERRAYERLEGPAREAYHARFWAFADPSMADAGNERRSAHYARHAWATILEDAPRARGMVSWGSDTEEILIRYGRPTHREQVRGPIWRIQNELSMVETFNRLAVSFVPPALLTEGLASTEPPGVRPGLVRDTVRSSYASVALPYTRGLTVQAVRFQEGGRGRLLVAGMVHPDTAEPPAAAPEGRLVVLDTLGREIARVPGRVELDARGAVEVRAEVPLDPGHYVYRLEFNDDSVGRAGLAQREVTIPVPTPPGLSDLLVAEPDSVVPTRREGVRAAADLVFAPDSRLLVWAEGAGLARADGAAHIAVEWWVEQAGGGDFLGRALRWIGRQIGLASDTEPVRVRWDNVRREQPVPLSFSVDLAGLDAGLYRLSLRLIDRITGREATAARLFRILPEGSRFRD